MVTEFYTTIACLQEGHKSQDWDQEPYHCRQRALQQLKQCSHQLRQKQVLEYAHRVAKHLVGLLMGRKADFCSVHRSRSACCNHLAQKTYDYGQACWEGLVHLIQRNLTVNWQCDCADVYISLTTQERFGSFHQKSLKRFEALLLVPFGLERAEDYTHYRCSQNRCFCCDERKYCSISFWKANAFRYHWKTILRGQGQTLLAIELRSNFCKKCFMYSRIWKNHLDEIMQGMDHHCNASTAWKSLI